MTTLINSIYEQYLTKKYAEEIKEFQDVVGGILNKELQFHKNSIANSVIHCDSVDKNYLSKSKETYKKLESLKRTVTYTPLQVELDYIHYDLNLPNIKEAYDKLHNTIIDGEVNGLNCKSCIPKDVEIEGIEAFDLERFSQELAKRLFNNK